MKIEVLLVRPAELWGIDLRAGAVLRINEAMARELVRRRVARYRAPQLVRPPSHRAIAPASI